MAEEGGPYTADVLTGEIEGVTGAGVVGVDGVNILLLAMLANEGGNATDPGLVGCGADVDTGTGGRTTGRGANGEFGFCTPVPL